MAPTTKPDGAFLDAATLRFERLLPGSIDRVWAYLTESEKRRKWLARGRMELHMGGRVELHFLHAELSLRREPAPPKYRHLEAGYAMHGHMARCDPPRALSYSWGDAARPSEVTFELARRGKHVLLVLTHGRIAPGDMASVAGGWHTHLGILADHLEDFPSQPFWPAHTKWEAEYARRLPLKNLTTG